MLRVQGLGSECSSYFRYTAHIPGASDVTACLSTSSCGYLHMVLPQNFLKPFTSALTSDTSAQTCSLQTMSSHSWCTMSSLPGPLGGITLRRMFYVIAQSIPLGLSFSCPKLHLIYNVLSISFFAFPVLSPTFLLT